MHCAWQVEEMLRFFTSVRLLMWIDSPSLRHLVIVEAQWLVDGVGRVIRDHTGVHADKEMAMRAREKFMEKEFKRLTHGKALLTRELCDKVLWADEEFKVHVDFLLQLMADAGLIVPLRRSPCHLVPALLPDEPLSDRVPSGAPTCHLHVKLRGRTPPERTLKPITAEEMQAGFLPLACFDHLIAVGIAWAQHVVPGYEPQASRQSLRLSLTSHDVLLTREDGAIRVQLLQVEESQSGGSLFALAVRPHAAD